MPYHNLREAPLHFQSSLGSGEDERLHDTLNLLPYAEALADIIQSCDTPLTIGIQGEWGSGKTSLMNMLRGSDTSAANGLLRASDCLAVNFETWPCSQFNRGNQLVIACLQALTARIQETIGETPPVDVAAVASATDRATEALAAVQRQLADQAAQPAAPGLPADASGLMLAFRREFERLIDCWTGGDPARRFVVFIDDLDRIPPAEALLLLEAVKQFIDVHGCVFVLAVNYEVVQQGMEEKFGAQAQRAWGKAFFDRIIQLPFVMPSASYQLEQYISGLLSHADFPFADSLADDAACRGFFLNITLCTIGRNPRNIKRVVQYTALLERVRERQGGGQLGPRDAQILYALVCMQIAWPELFTHFLHDPTVDTVTSLQNWEFLEHMPEAEHLFRRELDRERVKINVGTFFDTLFSLLDENDDGQIDSRELGPVLDVMSLACMTEIVSRERPRDWIVRRVHENNVDNDPLVETFLNNVFMKSVWYLGSECRYRKSGERFVTLVHQGRQIGSLVSLRSQPFVFRLAMAPEKVKSGIGAYWKRKHSVKKDVITFTRSVFGKEASMTGFGDTVVDYSKMTNMPSNEAIGVLNALFRIVCGDELTEWELASRIGGK